MARGYGGRGGGSETWHFVVVFGIAFILGYTLGKKSIPVEIPPVNIAGTSVGPSQRY